MYSNSYDATRSGKKQFHKLVKILQGYGIIAVGVQLSVFNIPKVPFFVVFIFF